MRSLRPFLLAFLALSFAAPASAHTILVTKTHLDVRPSGIEADVRFTREALAIYAGKKGITGGKELAASVLSDVHVSIDGRERTGRIVQAPQGDLRAILAGDRIVSFRCLWDTEKRAERLDMSFFFYKGFESDVNPIFEVLYREGDAEKKRISVRTEAITILFGAGGTAAKDAGQSFVQFLRLGFTHILPEGLDHILFILGLYLLARSPWGLVKQVTAFTVAHSITLALSILGVFSLPSSVVEPVIALSIAVVAIENVFTRDVHRWRWILVFCFGLIHGMGFAGVLAELGIAREHFLASLAAFNIGVELGQIAVIAIAAVLTAWFVNRPWYRRRVVIPASLAIAATGLFWTVQRICF